MKVALVSIRRLSHVAPIALAVSRLCRVVVQGVAVMEVILKGWGKL